jgi:hypothetical protein
MAWKEDLGIETEWVICLLLPNQKAAYNRATLAHLLQAFSCIYRQQSYSTALLRDRKPRPEEKSPTLTFWRRNYFSNFSTPVYKMWIIQETNTLELWNKLHFEEREKTESIYHV